MLRDREAAAFQAMAAIDAIGPATLLRRTAVDVTLLETTDGKTKARVQDS